MVYKKITLSDKIGYTLCENIFFKAYMILGGWAFMGILNWIAVALLTRKNSDWVWVVVIVSSALIGVWAFWHYSNYEEKMEYNAQLEKDAQMNLFRDFGLTK